MRRPLGCEHRPVRAPFPAFVALAALAIACGGPTPDLTKDPPRSSPSAPVATAGVAVSDRPLFDAHIHYSQDAWAGLSPEGAIAILREAGISRALVSSTPDSGTMRLYALDPALVVPILRPYRTRDDVGAWTRDPSVVPYVTSTLQRGVHRGIGELHLAPGDAGTPVVRAIVDLAVREGIFLHIHGDDRAIAEVLDLAPRARVLWAHAGMSASAKTVRGMLERYPDLRVELALRGDVAPGGRLDPDWRDLFIDHARRFMVGTDTWVPSRWTQVVEGHRLTREWLAQLPAEVADRIARRNAEELFGR